MSKIGKIDLNTFETFIMNKLGKPDKRVIVPPKTGIDAAVIDIGNDNVLIIAEDPIFPMPFGDYKDFGYYTVHIGASDVSVMGVKPQFMTYTLLMPQDTPDDDFKDIVDSIHKTASELGIAITGGHTGYYPAVTVPIIGGITVFSVAGKNAYVTPAGAKIGDKIIITKGPAIEATGILSVIYEKSLLKEFTSETIEKAKSLMKDITVVKDAEIAMKTGGVTSMHDATEGGVTGGLFEVASASNTGMYVDEEKFIFPEEVKKVMEFLSIDPIEAISEGTLIITVSSDKADEIVLNLAKENIASSIVGEVIPLKEGRKVKRISGIVEDLHIPYQDPFWKTFFKGLG